ncbi:MAG: hypothetical protein P8J48_04665 [SAR86 cluster bacterium]|nr:hypothetical protein [SAR86 cluster bacterium]
MDNNFFKILSPILLSFVLSSCSIAGTWVYERLDNYIANYFKEFANFTNEQNSEIDIISSNYLDWFSENELPKVKLLMEGLININFGNPEEEILLTYEAGEDLFQRTNRYFERPIIQFSKSLNNQQISEIESHFQELRERREERRGEQSQEYLDEIFENYTEGFNRVGISLRKDQQAILKLKLENYQPVRDEWSLLQEQWTGEFIELLSASNSYGYEANMRLFLRSFEEVGDENFRKKSDANQDLAIEIMIYMLSSANEKQIESFKRNLNTYLNSINRILSKRSVN